MKKAKMLTMIPAALLTVLLASCTQAATPMLLSPTLRPNDTASPAPSVRPTLISPVPLEVPQGNAPTLDGILSVDEWAGAYSVELSGGGKLLLMHDGGYLYLGLHASTKIVGSVSIDEGNQIRVLHSSDALGTALYEKGEGGWQRTQEFTWSCRDISGSDQAQTEQATHLQEEGWLATNAQMGAPGEMEYQIVMPENTLRLAVAYAQFADGKVFRWPEKLSDDSRNVELIGGDTPETLQFSPEQWITVATAATPTKPLTSTPALPESTAKPTDSPAAESGLLMLEYTFLIGGSGDEGPGWLHAPYLAPDGTLYLTGDTTSSNFPASTDAFMAEYQGGNSDGMEDTVLVAFNTRQPEVAYATYLGGAKGPEFISDVYVDAEQNIYLAGNSGSSDYPTTADAFIPQFQGPVFRHADGTLTILGDDGRSLKYASFLGGVEIDQALRIFVDPSGEMTIFGTTGGPDFPGEADAYPAGMQPGTALYALRLNAQGNQRLASRVLANTWGVDVRQLASGDFLIAGTTNNPEFQASEGAFDSSYNGGSDEAGGDVFIMRLSADLQVISMATLFGGSGEEHWPQIVEVAGGGLVVFGDTTSPDLSVTVDAAEKTLQGDQGLFLAQFSPDGSQLEYCTYLNKADWTSSIAYDGKEYVYLAGSTSSADFPVSPDAFDATYNGSADAFIQIFNLATHTIEYSSYLGGSGDEGNLSFAFDPQGGFYVVGTTTSDDFPTHAESPADVKGSDIFISKFLFNGPPTAELPASTLSFADSGQQLGSANSWDIQLVDINADGTLEAYFEAAIWSNDGAGNFTKSELSFGPADMQAWFADLNADGHVDAVCDNFVYLNDGQGGFAEPQPIPSDIPMLYAELADLNDDGSIDIITASATEDRVLINDGSGNFTDTGKTLGGWSQSRYAVGDINGDGFSDVYVAIPHTPAPDMRPATNLIWLGDGQGEFSEGTQDASVGQSRDVVMADFDGDGDLDLFIAGGTGTSKVFVNDGQGNFSDTGQSLNSGLHANDAQAADLDNDGDLDLLVANGAPSDNGQPNTVWLNDGGAPGGTPGQFSDSGLRLGNLNSLKVALGDLNGDGRIDAIVANVNVQTNDAPVEVWLNTAP